MKSKKEYEEELKILDSITKCVIRYAHSISTSDEDKIYSEWYQENLSYLRNKEREVIAKIQKLCDKKER